METLPSGTPLNPDRANQMNIDISSRQPGEPVLYTGPHLCVTCAQGNRITNLYLKAGEIAPKCPHCGSSARWEP